MNGFELNKIMGAVFATCLLVLGVGALTKTLYHTETPGEGEHGEKPGYAIVVEEVPQAGLAVATAAPVAPIGARLVKADATNGAKVAKACGACHDFSAGGPNKVGPNLYGVVGRGIASHDGFAYSDAVKAKSADTWTYVLLDKFLTSPKAFVPGTKMTFAGIPNPENRAALIAYLGTLSEKPVPYPAP